MSRECDRAVSELTFEEALRELEIVVSRLESNDLSLDEAIELFKRGISLSAHCNAKLERAEGMVKLLIQNQGKIEEVPFMPVEGDEV
ncbi:exodeoxyribonuclease VII small subunit [Caldicoprobacter algeriensis]|jgi:exodeoxyribonuclease VII small subunit|uniref:exodeoxyribonuclease VII small subunit n=1 Tax=Caldicoprobacter algeriensis TaxID=699281 RepID=UPI00207932B2|nr:exodeoxyribonuclease VII small subunit [Caldicoprobacter algeriensis]MCM8900887.1 exodeoxyribonuclease VII small subunit [Caldicoprobacter algeriensis]